MRTAPALTTLTLAATALLAGCGDQTPSAESPEPTPSYSVSTSAPTSPSPSDGLSDVPSDVPSGVASKSPTRKPSTTSSPATGMPTPTGAATSTPAAPSPTSVPVTGGTVHTYKNLTVRLPVADDAVPSAPTGFISYLRQALESDWKRLGGTPGCKKGGMVTVSATRSDGFAYVMRDVDPSLQSCPKAASMAGGYRAVWKDVDGTWKEVLAMQDVPPCTDFEKWAVPSAILGSDAQCLKGDDVVRYRHS
ncbi:hypothetical protein AB3X52_18600 [Nocardioides sp. DS6]|uniref:Uncharacterized protein n=1 Tax=Nocardioides eburneus TaxID=3231482 RepID=A0ABV3T5Y1_9ACTN